MGRVKVGEHYDRGVFDTLLQYGVDRDLARAVAISFRQRDAATALYQLYLGGWKVCGFKVRGGAALGLRKTKNGHHRFAEIGDYNEVCGHV